MLIYTAIFIIIVAWVSVTVITNAINRRASAIEKAIYFMSRDTVNAIERGSNNNKYIEDSIEKGIGAFDKGSRKIVDAINSGSIDTVNAINSGSVDIEDAINRGSGK